MNTEATSGPRSIGGSSFPTTHWSIVLEAGASSDTRARVALETLCRQYWYPLYAYVRRHGRMHHEAEDCTQAFFARLLANDGVTRARPDRGRFRTFLLTSLHNFLANEWRDAHAAKRGGDAPVLSIEVEDAAERFEREPVDPALTPEQAFDRNWALALIAQVIDELRAEYVATGRRALFEALQPLLLADVGTASIAEPAALLGMSKHAFSVALHRVRRRLGENLRAAVAETVAAAADVDAELRHLVAALR